MFLNSSVTLSLLLYLYDNHILREPPKPAEPTSKIGKFFSKIKDKVFPAAGEPLYSYSGGPGSTYGIGNTDIRKYTNTGGALNFGDSVDKFTYSGSLGLIVANLLAISAYFCFCAKATGDKASLCRSSTLENSISGGN